MKGIKGRGLGSRRGGLRTGPPHRPAPPTLWLGYDYGPFWRKNAPKRARIGAKVHQNEPKMDEIWDGTGL